MTRTTRTLTAALLLLAVLTGACGKAPDVDEVIAERDVLTDTAQSLVAELASVESALAEARGQAEAKQAQIDEIIANLEVAEDDRDLAIAERDRAREGRDNARGQLQTYRDEIADLNREIEALSEQNQDLVGVPEPPSPAVSAPEPAPSTTTFSVVRVVDGDTIELADGRRVRLAIVNTPERSDCAGAPATAYTTLWLGARGNTVELRRPAGAPVTDTYGRTIAEVVAAGDSLNVDLYANGHAVVDDRFTSEDPDLASRLAAISPAANIQDQCSRAAQAPVPAAAPAPAPAPASAPAPPPPTPTGEHPNCDGHHARGEGNFPASGPEGEHHRDGDGDGTVCDR